MLQSNELELAWAAGLFDGEGTVGFYPDKRGWYRPKLALSQNDPQVLNRFQKALGFGKVYGPYDTGHQPAFVYSLTSRRMVRKAVNLLLPYLSPVKQHQVEKTIRDIDEYVASFPYERKRNE